MKLFGTIPTFAKTLIFYKELFRLGIKHIKDIHDQENQRYCCFHKLQEKFNLPANEFLRHVKVRKEAKIRERYNQVPHLTQDTTWESNKKHNKHHIQEPRGQLFSSR